MACRMYFHRWTPGKMDGMKDNIIDCQMARWLTPLNEVNKLQFGKVKRKKKERKKLTQNVIVKFQDVLDIYKQNGLGV